MKKKTIFNIIFSCYMNFACCTYYFLLQLFCTSLFLSAQVTMPEQHKKLFAELQTAIKDTGDARIYIQCANYFLDKTPTFGPDLDTAGKCIAKAAEILLPFGNKSQVKEVRFLQARQCIKSHDPESGCKIFMQYISQCQAGGWRKEAAECWYQYAVDMMKVDVFVPAISSRALPLQPDYTPVFLANMEKAVNLARKCADKRLQTLIAARMTAYYLTSGNYQAAEKELGELMVLQKSTRIFKPYEITYFQLMLAYWQKKDMVSAVSLSLDALRTATAAGCLTDARPIYIMLGRTFNSTGDKASAAAAIRDYLAVCKQADKPVDPAILHYYLWPLLTGLNKEDALNLVKSFNYNNPLYTSARKFTVLKSYAQVYTYFKQYEIAEGYFVRAQKIAESAQLAEKNEFLPEFGKLYYLWGKYDKARPFFEQTLNAPDVKIALNNLENAHLFLYKIDSATGNYAAAMAHYIASAKIKDTLQNELMRKNIAELNIIYETAKKENDIQLLNSKIKMQQLDAMNKVKNLLLLNNKVSLQQAEAINKEKNIQLLNSRVKLEQYKTGDREKSIQVLTGNAKLQVSELQKARLIKNLTITGSVLLLIILGFLFNQYRINKRNNETVRANNASLQALLKEKEVLMKEIHHRVKNNLQMVLSLLESQSAYLENEALTAIQSSHNRVLAMSLIHQKLYITDNASDIDMSVYLWELVSYLQESFSTAGRIFFNMHIAPIVLDLVQAVPLGLIVNEAVTNSIKYAFPGNRKGTVSISLQEEEQGLIVLHIADNGIGFPKNFDVAEGSSLGLRLIKGLSNNLEANLCFETKEGTAIKIQFANIHAAMPA